jgi:hypothetical protein
MAGGLTSAGSERRQKHSSFDSHKKTPACRGFLLKRWRLDGLNVGSLLAFGTSGHFEGNALVFLQGLEAAGLDLGEVGEEVFAAAVGGDEAVALGVIEPFNDASLHLSFLNKDLMSRLFAGAVGACPGSIEIKEKLIKLIPHLQLESHRLVPQYTALGKSPSDIFSGFSKAWLALLAGGGRTVFPGETDAPDACPAKTGKASRGYNNRLIFKVFSEFLKPTGAKHGD